LSRLSVFHVYRALDIWAQITGNKQMKNLVLRPTPGFILSSTLVLLLFATARADDITVQLQGSASAEFLVALQTRLGHVLTAISQEQFAGESRYFTSAGFKSAEALLSQTKFKPAEARYSTNLLILPEGDYEVRDIRVEQGVVLSERERVRYLVFSVTRQGLISDIRFALESHLVPEVIRKNISLDDAITYNKIIDFLEVFRTAYNRKDLDYITRVYSDSALIIVGHIVRNAPKSEDSFGRSTLTGDKIKFVRFNKKQYISNLAKAFGSNSYISIEFENIEILQHPLNPNFYGVVLEQKWSSASYSDHGYLFMMFDFTDGTTVGLGDFLIMPKSSAPKADSTAKPAASGSN
jgi:hypothetical protein